VTAEIGDDTFVGYTFGGSPERRSRLWFLDRHLILMAIWGENKSAGLDIDVGHWTLDIPWPKLQSRMDFSIEDPLEVIRTALPGLHVRYEHSGAPGWTAVWRITDTIIPHVHTFGFANDVWRLGLWPD
jgi:hypothetical protein